MSENEMPDILPAAAGVVASGAAAYVGIFDPQLAPVAAAAAAAAPPAIQAVVAKVMGRRQHAQQGLLQTATVSLEEAQRRLLESDEGLTLLQEVLPMVDRAAHEAKARAFGVLLGEAASAPDVDAAAIASAAWARVVNRLETPHVRALAAMARVRERPSTHQVEFYQERREAFHAALAGYDAFTRDLIQRELIELELVQHIDSYQVPGNRGTMATIREDMWVPTLRGLQVVRRLASPEDPEARREEASTTAGGKS